MDKRAESSATRLQAVLFVCSMNAVRSPMAEAIARMRFGKKLYIDSAGLRKSERDTFMLTVLREIGIEFDHDEPRNFDEVDCEAFDLVVALSAEAHGRAKELLRATAVELVYWPIEDATEVGGTRDQRIEAYRRVREAIDGRIRNEIGARLKV
jgi:protein-tyrosine-phosphatase